MQRHQQARFWNAIMWPVLLVMPFLCKNSPSLSVIIEALYYEAVQATSTLSGS